MKIASEDVFLIEINILELPVNWKHAKVYTNLNKWTLNLKSEEMNFRLQETKYGWKMLADFKWNFTKFGELLPVTR